MCDGLPPQDEFYKQWIDLYHGAGRPYRVWQGDHAACLGTSGAQRLGAFRAPDGSDAVIVVNAAGTKRQATLCWHGVADSATV